MDAIKEKCILSRGDTSSEGRDNLVWVHPDWKIMVGMFLYIDAFFFVCFPFLSFLFHFLFLAVMGLLKLSSIYKSRKNTKESTTTTSPPSVPSDRSAPPKLEPLKLSLDFESSSTPVFNTTTTTTTTSDAPAVSSIQQKPATSATNITTTTNVSTATTVPAGTGGTLFDDILSELNSPKPAANQQSGTAIIVLFMYFA